MKSILENISAMEILDSRGNPTLRVGDCDAAFPVPQGHGDGAKHSRGPDSREGLVRKPGKFVSPIRNSTRSE